MKEQLLILFIMHVLISALPVHDSEGVYILYKYTGHMN